MEVVKKMNKKDTSYSIGLDIGTNSVGWAVMDSHYNLLKKDNHHMWGSRLFEQANPASERRLSRSARRRYNKRRERIRLLQGIMEPMIAEVDPTFYIRLTHSSFLDREDKEKIGQENGFEVKNQYNLFIDDTFNDQIYYKKYKTIYHLRKHLMTSTEKEDPRLIYLALHHIVKYRGNFLYEGHSFNMDSADIEKKIYAALEQFFDLNEFENNLDDEHVQLLVELLKKTKQRSQKRDEIVNTFIFDKKDKAIYKELANALVGLQFNVTKLLPAKDINKDGKAISLKFDDANYDANLAENEAELGESIEFIEALHDIYSWVELQAILGASHTENPSISEAMVSRYDDFKNDLLLLKKVVKESLPDLYNEVFRKDDEKLHNYTGYMSHPGKTSVEDFYKYIKNLLKNVNTEDAQTIKEKMDLETFLVKQNSRTNGAVPYQMQEYEMEQIIDHQAEFYPLLAENKDKLMSILTYRIPYYVGPLNSNSPFAWIKKVEGKENERIHPWNANEVIDIDATAEGFIKRMLSYCTYFPDEEVLPKMSLTISRFEVLNELNKIRVNGKKIKPDIKKSILDDLFMNNKKVTRKKLDGWLKAHQVYKLSDELEITGFQKEDEFSTSLTPWIDFTKIFGEINQDNYDLIESIIFDLTIFEDKKILKRRLQNNYHLDHNQIEQIMRLRYKDWSRLSRKLLLGIRSKNHNETVMDILENTNHNLMEIINDDKYGFNKIIDAANEKEEDGPFTYEEVEKLAGSPALKRGIWQSLMIVEEITKYMQHRPTNIYIEFAREEGEKVRTTSQIKRLQAIYRELDLETEKDKEVYKSLNNEDDKKINTDALYLYYTQMGKSMYSGKPLDIDKLDTYQIDHIIPQSLIKDDSFDNRVLVLPEENQFKLDQPTVPAEVRNKMIGFWTKLLENKLISKKKFFNLIKTEYNEKDQERFINRQLVETRQIIKNVANIIMNHYKGTDVRTVRANISHDFRKRYDIYKSRDLNDYHHAHDAYIACVVGNYIKCRFKYLDTKYIYGQYFKNYKKDAKKRNNDGFVLNSMVNAYCDEDTGETIWDPAWISKIKKCFYYKDVYITKKLERNDGVLFNLTVLKNDAHSDKAETSATVPVNKYRADVHKYGGFAGLQYQIFEIHGHKQKGKKVVKVDKLTQLPIYLSHASNEEKEKYVLENEGLIDVKIGREILKNQLIETDGGLFYLVSPTEYCPAYQISVNEHVAKILDQIQTARKYGKYDRVKDEELLCVYDTLLDKMKKLYPIYKNLYKKFEDKREDFQKLTIEDKCYVVVQMLITLHANSKYGDIRLPNFKMRSFVGRLNMKTIDLSKTVFYADSVTGLYRKKFKL